jgi:2-desacetyl-2-hydroxyethyl bacteriochlorophyllide A dehydrogenase
MPATTATAIKFPAPNQVELGEYALPSLHEDEVQVRTEYSGVSQGTEIWALQGRRPELRFPTVPGYQSVGRVERVGAAVKGVAEGDRVLFTSSRLPESYPETWMAAHVSRAVVPGALGDKLFLLDPDIDPIASAIAALPAVCHRGIQMIKIAPGDCVVVTGLGLIGQTASQLATAAGGLVIAVDLDPRRRTTAKNCGAAVTVDPSREDLAKAVRTIKPAGADLVIEATGRSAALKESIDLLRWEGQILLQGWYPEPISFDFHHAHLKKPIIAISCGVGSIPDCLHLLRHGRLRLRELITHCVPVTHAPQLYLRMAQRDPEVLGVVFDWSGVA